MNNQHPVPLTAQSLHDTTTWEKRNGRSERARRTWRFELNVAKKDERHIMHELEKLTRHRKAQTTIREALRAYFSALWGDFDLLFELIPGLQAEANRRAQLEHNNQKLDMLLQEFQAHIARGGTAPASFEMREIPGLEHVAELTTVAADAPPSVSFADQFDTDGLDDL